MIDKGSHVAWAADAVAVFQKHCGTSDEHAIADLICDLGHLAEGRGFDFLDEVRRGIGHWYAEVMFLIAIISARTLRWRSPLFRGSLAPKPFTMAAESCLSQPQYRHAPPSRASR